jgi:hypothetical protein
MTPAGINTVAHYKAAIQAFANEQSGMMLGELQQQKLQTQPALDLSVYINPLLDSQQRVQENLMLLVSDYHGHPPAAEASGAQGGSGVEVRMVRQISPPAAKPAP